MGDFPLTFTGMYIGHTQSKVARHRLQMSLLLSVRSPRKIYLLGTNLCDNISCRPHAYPQTGQNWCRKRALHRECSAVQMLEIKHSSSCHNCLRLVWNQRLGCRVAHCQNTYLLNIWPWVQFPGKHMLCTCAHIHHMHNQDPYVLINLGGDLSLSWGQKYITPIHSLCLSICTCLVEHPMCNTVTFKRDWGLVPMAMCLATRNKALGSIMHIT